MIFFLLMCCTLTASAQGQVKGKVLDKKNNEPVGFVTIRVSHQDSTDLVKGSVTDLAGNFRLTGSRMAFILFLQLMWAIVT
jgi:hypothetical protein